MQNVNQCTKTLESGDSEIPDELIHYLNTFEERSG